MTMSDVLPLFSTADAAAVALILAGWLGMRLAARVAEGGLIDRELIRALFWTRVLIQSIGLVAILVTTMWGMWHNLTSGALGF